MKNRITLCLLFVHGVIATLSLTLAGCPNNAPGFCSDGLCRPSEGETCSTCAADCICAGCGDSVCSAGESCASCPSDCGGCGPACGDGVCAASENCSICPGDCGMCATTCGPSNCAGCCSGNTCLAGTATNACGLGGSVCLDCGPGFLCQGASCVVDPASRWTLYVDSYTVSATNYAGSAWDNFGGAPDPVVSFQAPNATTSLGSVNGPDDSFTATLTRRAAAMNVRADVLTTYLRASINDEDVTDYEFIGACIVTSQVPLAFNGSVVTTTCPVDASTGNSGFTLRWHLERF